MEDCFDAYFRHVISPIQRVKYIWVMEVRIIQSLEEKKKKKKTETKTGFAENSVVFWQIHCLR